MWVRLSHTVGNGIPRELGSLSLSLSSHDWEVGFLTKRGGGGREGRKNFSLSPMINFHWLQHQKEQGRRRRRRDSHKQDSSHHPPITVLLHLAPILLLLLLLPHWQNIEQFRPRLPLSLSLFLSLSMRKLTLFIGEDDCATNGDGVRLLMTAEKDGGIGQYFSVQIFLIFFPLWKERDTAKKKSWRNVSRGH